MRLAYARQVADWSHTAQLLAMLHNINRGKDDPALDPGDFHPLLPPTPPEKMSLMELRGITPPKR